MKSLSVAALALLLVSSLHLRAEDRTAAAEIEFAKLTDQILSDGFEFQPLNAVGLGLHQYDGKFVDFSRAAIDAEIQRNRAFQASLASMDPTVLSGPSQLDYKLLKLGVENDIFQLTDLGTFDRNPMTYAEALDANSYLKRNFAPLADRLRDLVAIEKKVPALLVAARENLKDVLPKPEVELAIDIAKGNADFLLHDLVDAVKDVRDDALQQEFKAVNERAATELASYADWLGKERLPKADPKSYALGDASFRRMLQTIEAIDLSPGEVLKVGEAELKHQQAAFQAAAKIIDPKKPAPQVFLDIQNDHPTAESLIPDVKKHLETIRAYVVSHDIIDIPSEVRSNVAETPKYEREGSFASSDNPGPFEVLGAQAYYYVTPVEPDWTPKEKEEWLTSFNYYTTDVVSIHEVYPGHYVQALRLNASPVSKVQRTYSSYAYAEGWAHYCEQMVIDEGYGSTPNVKSPDVQGAKYRLAQADEALLRVCRLCVSVKLHTQGMSVEEATKFFMDNCYYEEKTAHQEALRGTYDPGYCFYTIGKLELLKLRKDWQAQEGTAYTLKRFNDAITDHGWPPVRFLREILLKDKSKAGETL